MFSGHLRELIYYERMPNGEIVKKREGVPSFNHPTRSHEIFAGSRFDPRRVFFPDGNFLPMWGLLMMVTIVSQAIVVPFMVAFDVEDTKETVAMDFACTVVYMLDIAVTCNTGFYKKGILVESRREIGIRYLRTWFTLDFLSTFPYDWFFQQPLDTGQHHTYRAASVVRMIKIGRLLRSLRLIRLVKLRTYLAKVRQKLMDSKLAIAFTAVYLLTVMLGLAHWVACGFYAMSLTTDSTDTWIYHSELQDSIIKDIYIASLYWAITTLTTTGYGDIHPISTNEKIYGIFIMIISAGAFSFIIGKIGTSIANVDRDAKDHKDLTMAVTQYLNQSQVPTQMVRRATDYIDHVWESRKKRKILDHNVMSHFSGPLQREICQHMYAPMLSRVPLFNKFGQMTSSIATEVFAPDDSIFVMGQMSTQLYFVEKGRVNIYHEITRFPFAELSAGDHFGELAFFTGEPRCASAGCQDFAELLSLKRDYFLSLLTPELRYSYNQIQDFFNARDFYAMGMSCYLCEGTSHLAWECSKHRVVKDKNRIWQKWMNKKSTSIPITPGVTVANFERQERKVRRTHRFALENTKKEEGTMVKREKIKLVQSARRARFMEDFVPATIYEELDFRVNTEMCLMSPRRELHTEGVEEESASIDHENIPESAASAPVPPFLSGSRREAWKNTISEDREFYEDL